jgi:NAD(P)H dehydrogenase (quinone)
LFLGCKYIEAIFHICPNMCPEEVEIGRNILLAAKRSGVKHFVYHSVLHPQVQSMPHHWNKLMVEEQVLSSGINFTILQPTAYLQNIVPYWQRIVTEGVYEVPYPAETRLSMVDLEDVAQAASVVTNNPGYYAGIFELVATQPYSQDEVAQIIGARIHKEVHVIQGSRTVWERNARQNGMNDYAVVTLLSMFEYYEKYGMRGNPHVLQSIINRTPLDLPEFINRLIHSESQQHEVNNG